MRIARQLGTVVTHAGNLDPMGEGVLILLIGPEAQKQQARLQSADKEYEFDLLFGFSTDSYDALGLITEAAGDRLVDFREEDLREQVSRLKGRRIQTVPPYSSLVVKGKPLFWWARQGRIGEVGLPRREIRIDQADLIRTSRMSVPDLRAIIFKGIAAVKGDFRQPEITARWARFIETDPGCELPLATIRMTVSAGTYVRSIGHELGAAMGIPALVMRILRTRSGNYTLSDCQDWEGPARGASSG